MSCGHASVNFVKGKKKKKKEKQTKECIKLGVDPHLLF
jgi:hypothetical protein